MRRLVTLLLPIVVIGLGIFIMLTLLKTAPEPKRVQKPVTKPVVEILTLARENYQIQLRSQGSIEPRTQSQLVAEVRGKVRSVSDSFVEGGFFKAGETLLTLDDKDYHAAFAIAEADLAQAKVSLSQERARADQAMKDWTRLGGGEEANDLVTRKAFVDSAAASVAAAQARVTQAKLDLKRTRVKAPFDGRILEKKADVGQFVNTGSALAQVFAVDYAEIKLPLTDAAFAKLPTDIPAKVTLSAQGNVRDAKIVRVSGTVDTQSRQKSVIAELDDPYGLNGEVTALEIGSFVDAIISGAWLEDVYIIPANVIREGRFVLIEENGKLRRLAIEPVWETDSEVVVKTGLEPGMHLITTPLSYAVEGMSVKVVGKEKAQ